MSNYFAQRDAVTWYAPWDSTPNSTWNCINAATELDLGKWFHTKKFLIKTLMVYNQVVYGMFFPEKNQWRLRTLWDYWSNTIYVGEGTLVKSLGENSLREIGHLVNVYFQVVKWTCTSWNLVSFGEKNFQLVKLPFNWWKRVSIGDH